MAGIPYVLEETYKVTRDEKYRREFLSGLEALARQAQYKRQGVEWSATTDIISGSAGTRLVMLRWAASDAKSPVPLRVKLPDSGF